MLNILYQDDDIICCIKPAGILSQQGGGESMVSLLRKAGLHYAGVVHRLDRNAGGIMVFAKTEAAAAALAESVRNREITKEYLAVVHNRPAEESGVFRDLLFFDSTKNKTFVVDRMRKGVREASLEYQVLKTKSTEYGEISLVKIRLHTGRTHQIRVQFGSRKMPLVGDRKYGSRCGFAGMALWSYRLVFRHPAKNEQMDIKYLPPDVFPWSEFEALSDLQ